MPRDLDFKREKRVRSRVHSFDMVRSQLPGLAAQVARGQVKNVVILDGANDFLLPLKAVTSSGPGRPGWSPTQVPHRSGRAR